MVSLKQSFGCFEVVFVPLVENTCLIGCSILGLKLKNTFNVAPECSDPLALGDPGPWGPRPLGTQALGDPWALGTRASSGSTGSVLRDRFQFHRFRFVLRLAPVPTVPVPAAVPTVPVPMVPVPAVPV